ncbi:hypothetical protein R69749_08480 [Paraburkholderia domus]|nr:hypothetical protein R69749_08480 [Paraburkholderia domus]
MIEKHHLYTVRAELLHQQRLVRIFARQAVWRQDVQPINRSERCSVPQTLQLWPDQRCTAHPSINEAHVLHNLRAVGLNSLFQCGDLAVYRAAFALLLG